MIVKMEKLLLIVACVVLSFCPATWGDTHVKGYYRKNGTYVKPHVRRSSSSSSSIQPKTTSPSHYGFSGSSGRINYGTTARTGAVKYGASTYHRRANISVGGSGYSSTKETCNPERRLFSTSMKKKKYEDQMGICPHCKMRYEYGEMEGDHIIPFSKGGKTTWENLQMLCRPCNRKKGNKYSY